MSVCVLDPLADARWDGFLDRHPRASVFHSRGWLEALKRTYGYEPIVVTTTGQGPLENGLVLCRVRNWRSRRLVSLPFTDHCDPLVDRPDALPAMLEFLRSGVEQRRWRSFELRPRRAAISGLAEGASYCRTRWIWRSPRSGFSTAFTTPARGGPSAGPSARA